MANILKPKEVTRAEKRTKITIGIKYSDLERIRAQARKFGISPACCARELMLFALSEQEKEND